VVKIGKQVVPPPKYNSHMTSNTFVENTSRLNCKSNHRVDRPKLEGMSTDERIGFEMFELKFVHILKLKTCFHRQLPWKTKTCSNFCRVAEGQRSDTAAETIFISLQTKAKSPIALANTGRREIPMDKYRNW
jgi:hypothetical protein